MRSTYPCNINLKYFRDIFGIMVDIYVLRSFAVCPMSCSWSTPLLHGQSHVGQGCLPWSTVSGHGRPCYLWGQQYILCFIVFKPFLACFSICLSLFSHLLQYFPLNIAHSLYASFFSLCQRSIKPPSVQHFQRILYRILILCIPYLKSSKVWQGLHDCSCCSPHILPFFTLSSTSIGSRSCSLLRMFTSFLSASSSEPLLPNGYRWWGNCLGILCVRCTFRVLPLYFLGHS